MFRLSKFISQLMERGKRFINIEIFKWGWAKFEMIHLLKMDERHDLQLQEQILNMFGYENGAWIASRFPALLH